MKARKTGDVAYATTATINRDNSYNSRHSHTQVEIRNSIYGIEG